MVCKLLFFSCRAITPGYLGFLRLRVVRQPNIWQFSSHELLENEKIEPVGGGPVANPGGAAL